MSIGITKFAYDSHFTDVMGSGTKITSHTPKEFLEKFSPTMIFSKRPGYADFCKIFVVENYTDAKNSVVKIDESNYQQIDSYYKKRRDNEPPFLVRKLHIDGNLPKAKYLHLIAYDTDQLLSEYEENPYPGNIYHTYLDEFPTYGIVAILGQDTIEEQPMQPHTYLRNTLPKKYGGSGIQFDQNEYTKCVNFWNNHVMVKPKKYFDMTF